MEVKFEHRLTEVEERSKVNLHRIEELEERQNNLDELVGTVKVIADREKRMEDDVKEIKGEVKNLTNKSAKKWDNLVSQIISILVAAIAGFVLAKIGLG